MRDSAATIEGAVVAALSQDYPGGVDVVIAEGRSRDDSRAIIERIAARDARVSVVDNPSGETPAALNAAILGSSGDVIVRCDAHAQLPDGYITAAVSRLHATGAGVVGGVQDAVGQTAFERAVAYAMANPLGSGGAAYRSAGAPGVVETVYLGVFPRAVLAEVGLFDESLQRSQDYELNHRIAAAGHDVFFAPELQVRYRPRGSVGSLWRQYFAYGQWKRHVVRRNPGSLRLRQLAAPALVAGLALSAAAVFSPWTGAGVAVPLVYTAAVLSVTGFEIARRGDTAAALIVVVLPTMHLAWGSGFWRGGTRAGEPRIRRLDA